MEHDSTLDSVMELPQYFQASEAATIMNRDAAFIARLGQIISPALPANGKGYRAAYSFQNLVEMRIVEEMVKFGVPRKRIAGYLTTIRDSKMNVFDDTQEEAWIIVDGSWRWQIANTFSAIQLGWWAEVPNYLLAVSIGKIKQELKARL